MLSSGYQLKFTYNKLNDSWRYVEEQKMLRQEDEVLDSVLKEDDAEDSANSGENSIQNRAAQPESSEEVAKTASAMVATATALAAGGGDEVITIA